MSSPRPDSERENAGPRGFVAPPSGDRLFRRRALERYAHRDEESVLPRLARPPVFAALWALVALLVILGGVVGAVPVADERSVPLVVTADGVRLVVPVDGSSEGSSGSTVSSGDPLRFVLAGEARLGRVGTVGEEIFSPADLGALGGVGLEIDGPRRLAAVELERPIDDASGAFRGIVVDARVTVDRPRAATLLPGVGPRLGEWIERVLPASSEEASP